MRAHGLHESNSSPLGFQEKPRLAKASSHISAPRGLADSGCRSNMEVVEDVSKKRETVGDNRGNSERRLNIPSRGTSGSPMPIVHLKPPIVSSTATTAPAPSTPLLAAGNIIIVSVDPNSTLRPLFADDGDGSLEKSASEMQSKAKKYLAFVRSVEHTTTTTTTTTMIAVENPEDGVEDQDVTIRRPSVASTIKGIEKKVTTTTTKVHLNLLHTTTPTRSYYDTVDETMHVPLVLYHPRTNQQKLNPSSTSLHDREPLRVRNGHHLFKRYKQLYAHTIMDVYAVVSEVTHPASATEKMQENTGVATKSHRSYNVPSFDRTPTISRRDLKRYDAYQSADRVKESNQVVTTNSPTTPTTPYTNNSFSSPRYPSTTRRYGKTSLHSTGTLSSVGGLPEADEMNTSDDEGAEAGSLSGEDIHGEFTEEDEDEDEDEDDEDEASQFRLSTVISSLTIDNEGSTAPWDEAVYRPSTRCRTSSSSSTPPISRSPSLRKRQGASSPNLNAPSSWKPKRTGSGRRSTKSPQPSPLSSSTSVKDNARPTSPHDKEVSTTPFSSNHSLGAPLSLQIPTISKPRTPTKPSTPKCSNSETDTASSSAKERTSSEWHESVRSAQQSDSRDTQATSVHSSQGLGDGTGAQEEDIYSSSFMPGSSSFDEASSSDEDRLGDDEEEGEGEEKVWKEKYDLGGGLGAHKPLNRQCLICVRAWFHPTTTTGSRKHDVASGDTEDWTEFVPEDPRMLFEELKMLRILERTSDMRYFARLKQQNAERVIAWRDTTASDGTSPFPSTHSDSEHNDDPSLGSSSSPPSRRSSALMSSLLGRRRKSSNNFNSGSSLGHGIFSSLNPFATAPATSTASTHRSSKRGSALHPSASGSEAEDAASHGPASGYQSSFSINSRNRSVASLHSNNRRRRSGYNPKPPNDGTDHEGGRQTRRRSSALNLHFPFFARTGLQSDADEDDGMTSGDGSSRRASVPLKKTHRSSLFSKQRPSLPLPLPIGLDPLCNKSAASGAFNEPIKNGVKSEDIDQPQLAPPIPEANANVDHAAVLSSLEPIHEANRGTSARNERQYGSTPNLASYGKGITQEIVPSPMTMENSSNLPVFDPRVDPTSTPIAVPSGPQEPGSKRRNSSRRESSALFLRKAWKRLTCQPPSPSLPLAPGYPTSIPLSTPNPATQDSSCPSPPHLIVPPAMTAGHRPYSSPLPPRR